MALIAPVRGRPLVSPHCRARSPEMRSGGLTVSLACAARILEIALPKRKVSLR